jgi:hypothetical protein
MATTAFASLSPHQQFIPLSTTHFLFGHFALHIVH